MTEKCHKKCAKKVSTKKTGLGPVMVMMIIMIMITMIIIIIINDDNDNDNDLYIQMKARVRKVERPVERGNCNLIVIILDKLARCNCNCSL